MKYFVVCLGLILYSKLYAWTVFQQDATAFTTRLEEANQDNISASELISVRPIEAIRFAESALRHIGVIKRNGYLVEGSLSTISRNKVLYTEIQSNYILAKAYQELTDYGRAVKYMQSALKLAQDNYYTDFVEQLRVEINELRLLEAENKKGLAKAFLGAKRALQDIVKNEDVQSMTGDLSKVRMDIHERRAETFEKEGDIENAINNFLIALELADKVADTLRISDYQNKIAALKLKNGDIREARLFAEDISVVDAEKKEINRDDAETLNPLLPRIHLDLESMPSPDNTQAKPTGEIPPRNISSEDITAYKVLADRLKASGDYEGALSTLNEYAAQAANMQALLRRRIEDSISTSRKIDSTRRVIDSLKIKNKEGELELQTKNFLIQQKKRQLSYFIMGGAAIVAIALLLYLLFMFQRRANRKLQQAYVELNKAHEKLKSAQAQLVESEKMASIGQLTAGIAHEINNPVNFISGNISPLKRDIADVSELIKKLEAYISSKLESPVNQKAILSLKEDYDYPFVMEEIIDLIHGIEEGAFRTAEIVKGLRNFARMDEDVPKWYDVRVGLDSTLSLLKHKIENIEMVKEYGEIPEILCLPGKLNQVFMNVLINAIQAMPQGGEIVIKTQSLMPDEVGEKNVQPGDYVKVSIIDQGTGIPEEIRVKVFDPFFTTKDVGIGTGLGLSISKGIIDQHQGEITIQDNDQHGTTVTILLPVNLEVSGQANSTANLQQMEENADT